MDWNAMAAPWLRFEAETDASHGPVRRELMARAGLRPGQRVLDIGPGAGITLLDAARAVGPEGRVTGLEIAPPFAERADARTPDTVDLIVADAQTHGFKPESFDAAISLFGVMFFEDSVAAFANIRRAMKPGAALHFACWGLPEVSPYFTMPAAVAEAVLGTGEPFDRSGPGPMRFGDAGALRQILRDAGWTAEVEARDITLTPPGTPEEVADFHMTIGAAATRMRQAKEAGQLTDALKAEVRAGLVAGFATLEHNGAVLVPGRFNFARAVA